MRLFPSSSFHWLMGVFVCVCMMGVGEGAVLSNDSFFLVCLFSPSISVVSIFSGLSYYVIFLFISISLYLFLSLCLSVCQSISFPLSLSLPSLSLSLCLSLSLYLSLSTSLALAPLRSASMPLSVPFSYFYPMCLFPAL